MYDSVPRAVWREPESGQTHIIDSYGEPGPVVRKPLCNEMDYDALVDRTADPPDGIFIEGRTDPLDTTRFDAVDPAVAVSGTLCSTCEERYLELLWRRPADYPAIEVVCDGSTHDATYMVADLHFVTDKNRTPSVQLVDELRRTKLVPMWAVREITPHSEMPVVY